VIMASLDLADITSSALVSAEIDVELLEQLERVALIRTERATQLSSPVELRRKVSEEAARLIAKRPENIEVQDVVVRGAWHDIPMRLYRRRSGGVRKRLMMYFHGGGWVTGSIETHDSLCAHIANHSDYVVASVGYRLAPEHPYPAATDDALAATLWMLRNRHHFEIHQMAGWAMGGDSAGAHTALCATLLMQENGFPICDRMLLFYPPVAPGLVTASRDFCRDGPGLTEATMEGFWRAYAGGRPDTPMPARFDLRRWRNLASLPPCVLLTAEHDFLRDEGEAFAGLLNCRGVRVHYRRAGGMIHGFARMLTGSDAARQHVDWACTQLLSF